MTQTHSRRSLLAIAGGGIAASAVLVAVKPALAAHGEGPDAARASPALKAAVRALSESHDALKAAKAAAVIGDGKVDDWKAAHLKPTSKRGVKRWERKLAEYRQDVCEEGWDALYQIEERFRKAQWAVATIDPANADDLLLMAAASFIYDPTKLFGERSAVIGFKAALSYFRLYGPAMGGAA